MMIDDFLSFVESDTLIGKNQMLYDFSKNTILWERNCNSNHKALDKNFKPF